GQDPALARPNIEAVALLSPGYTELIDLNQQPTQISPLLIVSSAKDEFISADQLEIIAQLRLPLDTNDRTQVAPRAIVDEEDFSYEFDQKEFMSAVENIRQHIVEVQYLGELGANVCVHRNDEIELSEIAALRPQGIVLSPGPGRPEEAGITLQVDGKVVYKKNGKNVAKKGELIVKIDNENTVYQYKKMVNNWRVLDGKHKRNTGQGVSISAAVMEELSFQLENARQDVIYLKDQIDSFELVAPENGIYDLPDLSIGDHEPHSAISSSTPGHSPLARKYFESRTGYITMILMVLVAGSIAITEVTLTSFPYARSTSIGVTAKYFKHDDKYIANQ
ncbi:unnamed protein product, partial [Cyprideis torosa]